MTEPDDWITRRFHSHVSRAVFADAAPSNEPVWITVGGQPGAGKTAAQVLARRLNPGASVTPIIGDDLRLFHPDYRRLVEQEPLQMPEATAEASATWIRASLDHAREHGYGVLVESTFRSAAVTIDTAAAFREAGYRTHVVAVAVPPWESRLSTLDRFVIDHAAGRAARWTPLQAHEAGVTGTPQTLAAAIASPQIDRISVVNRSGTVLFDGTRPEALDAAQAVLDAEHRRLPTRSELRDWTNRFANNTHYLEHNVPATAETNATVATLQRDQSQLEAAVRHQQTALMSFPTNPIEVLSPKPQQPDPSYGTNPRARGDRDRGAGER